ncbi:MAG: hypothetical protein J5738_04130 [Lachnospiraceae bacterium]|nr:hypothetical protein [Lachnospiraceae bacterium]
MKGKEKCRMLKQIRKKIADANDIPYVVEECPHQGECRGTCPKCEAELRKMEQELSLRRRIGKGIAVVGVAAGVMASTTACDAGDVVDFIEDAVMSITNQRQIDGDVPAPLAGDVTYITEGEAVPWDDKDVNSEDALAGKVKDDITIDPDEDLMGLVAPNQFGN